MASLITIRLYKDDGTPKISANPKLSAIREKDNKKVLDSVNMVEVGEGFYKFNFKGYNRGELYFFYIDGEQYEDVNILDSYGNKHTRGQSSSFIFDEKKLAENVWKAKKEDMKKDTVGEHLFGLENVSFSDIEKRLGEIFDILFKKSDEIGLIVKGAINGIKISEKYDDTELLKTITSLTKTSLESYTEKTLNALNTLEKVITNNILSLKKEENTEEENELQNILENIDGIYKKIEEFQIIKENTDLNIEKGDQIKNNIDVVNQKIDEINRKMQIVFSRLNHNK